MATSSITVSRVCRSMFVRQRIKTARLQALLVERELSLVAGGAFALVEQFCDLELPRQRALAPHFRRMGGQDRTHQRAIEEIAERARLDAHLARALKGVSQRAGTRRGAGDRVRAVAADVMLILGDVGEMREIAVGAHDRERLVGAQAVQRRLKLAPRGDLVVAMEADRSPADLLDQLEDLFALLLAHRVAEDSAEQADVVAQGDVLVGVVREGGSERFGSGRCRAIGRIRGESCKQCCTAADFGARLKDRQIRRDLRFLAPPLYLSRRASASRALSAALSLSSHS